MNTGDFVYINYIGRIKDTKEIFDLTKEEVAKKENVFDPKIKYGPVPVIVDAKFILPGLNDALKGMNIGEKKTVEIPPEKAFGHRNPELIKLIPEARFKEQNMNVTPGSFVTINRIKGRIVSVGGGRVKVDFNHPLAEKTLEYELEVVSEIKEPIEKMKAVAYYFTGMEKDDIGAKIKDNEVEITIRKKVNVLQQTKEVIAKTITKWVQGIEKVKFVEIFEK